MAWGPGDQDKRWLRRAQIADMYFDPTVLQALVGSRGLAGGPHPKCSRRTAARFHPLPGVCTRSWAAVSARPALSVAPVHSVPGSRDGPVLVRLGGVPRPAYHYPRSVGNGGTSGDLGAGPESPTLGT